MIKRKSVIISAAICLVAAIIAAFSGFTVARAANIVKGDTTANIKAVQTRLATLGYYTYKVDGIWGSRTKKAVKKYRCKLCGHVFEVADGETPVCPVCKATGDNLELLG